MATEHADPELETILDRHQLTGRLTTVALDDIDWEATRRAQLRSIDQQVVERYQAAIERGETLPAGFGTIDSDGRVTLVGGQHRGAAHRNAGSTRMPLYLVDGDERNVWRASIEHNTRHGVPLPNKDRTRVALDMVDRDGLTVTEAAAIVGLHPVTLSRSRSVRTIRKRADRLGVGTIWRGFSTDIQYRLGVGAKKHSDDVFREMVAVATQCDITKELARRIGDGLQEAAGDSEAFEYLEQFEVSWHPGMSNGGGTKAAAQLRRLATEICDIDPDEVADTITGSFAQPTVELLERAARRIAECAMAIKAGQQM